MRALLYHGQRDLRVEEVPRPEPEPGDVLVQVEVALTDGTDAKAFRPWDRANSCLRSFRVETCGDVVFVNLSDNPPPLREWLGAAWEPWSTVGGVYRFAGFWERDFSCNWKVVLENSLEGYHIPQVHPKSFARLLRRYGVSRG